MNELNFAKTPTIIKDTIKVVNILNKNKRNGPIPKDFSNLKFGRLTVISIATNRGKQNQILWNCICNCGNNKIVSGANLKHNITRSCGCLLIESKKREKSPKDIKRCNSLYHRIKKGAAERNFCFKLTKEDVYKLIFNNCFYCNSKDKICVDRIDSNEGYILSNSLPCCAVCNFGKHNYSFEEYIKYLDNQFLYFLNITKEEYLGKLPSQILTEKLNLLQNSLEAA